MTCRRHYPYPLPNWAQTQTIGLNLGVGKLGHSLPTRCCPPNAHVSHEIVSPITKQNKNNKKKKTFVFWIINKHHPTVACASTQRAPVISAR